MSDQNDQNQFEDYQPEEYRPPAEQDQAEQEVAPVEKGTGSNRNFLIAIGVVAGIFLLALVAMGVFAASILPQRQAAQKTLAAEILLQNTSTAAAATAIAMSDIQAQTPTSPPPPTATLTVPPPTNTPVVVVPTATATVTPVSGSGQNKAETPNAAQLAQGTGQPTLSPGAARTATLAVLLTQVAGKQTPQVGGASGTTPTALPSTGFADEVGLPGLFGLTLGLIVLILLARGLRLAARH